MTFTEEGVNLPEKLNLLLPIILEKEPRIDPDLAASLAQVYQWEVDEIMRLTLEFTRATINSPIHVTLKDDVHLFYAQFLHHVGTVVVAKNGERGLSNLDPNEELSRATSSSGKERIRNSARIYADHIFVPMHEKWRSRTEALVALQARPPILPPRSVWTPAKARKPRTRNNHYIPQFSTKHWADSSNEVMVFSRGLGGSVTGEPKRAASWAAEEYLYSQQIEDYFSSVELHAAGVYRKLLDGTPLTGPDRQNWIIFLICQMLRVPSYILLTLSFLKGLCKERGWPYPTTPEALVKAWEYHFATDGPAISFYPYFDKKSWVVMEAHQNDFFIQPDEPLAIVGALKSEDSLVLFPLSPRKCFAAGPFEKWLLGVKGKRLAEGEANEVVGVLAANARKSAVSRISDDSPSLRGLLEGRLATGEGRRSATLDLSIKYWGGLSR